MAHSSNRLGGSTPPGVVHRAAGPCPFSSLVRRASARLSWGRLLAGLGAGLLGVVASAELTENKSAAAGGVAADVLERVAKCLKAEGLPVNQIDRADMPGMLQVDAGDDYLYVTEDCRHFISGDLFEIHPTEGVVPITERVRTTKRQQLIDEMPLSELLVFSPLGKPARASIVVFTDTDCGYCRKLHQEMADYNELGIEVRYAAYPRAGVGSATYDRMVSAWCADDPLGAMTKLKNGEDIDAKNCANPVADQFEIGRRIGLRGTPTIVVEDGRVLPGYIPAADLADYLEL